MVEALLCRAPGFRALGLGLREFFFLMWGESMGGWGLFLKIARKEASRSELLNPKP